MKTYVITIKGMEPSEAASQKCITTGAEHNVDVTLFDAYTPKDKPFDIFVLCGGKLFKDSHNSQAALGCMLSHYMLWKKCVEINEVTLITEHDAIFVSEVPDIIKNGEFAGLVNLAKPGYGRMTSISAGLGPMRSKGHLPGTHGYAVKPEG
jgi:GR25 family glycosyltransferase involved in LPS biosynthesis